MTVKCKCKVLIFKKGKRVLDFNIELLRRVALVVYIVSVDQGFNKKQKSTKGSCSVNKLAFQELECQPTRLEGNPLT